ncbi:ATP-binding protein [Nibricoccus sp. IMCC34717]|uniref:ATP-binding protein n=1 Tax=Nibricoccus sp. IMCC34717 TaxID=3034021 RepID=UPI00384B0A29
MTLRIHYYDPEWRVLFAQSGDNPTFVFVSKTPMPLEVGQIVRIRGSLGNEQGLYAPTSQITPVGAPGLPGPVLATDRLLEESFLKNRFVRIEAFVERQDKIDALHTRLLAKVHERRITIRLLTKDGEPPDFANTFVQADGVYTATAQVGPGLSALELWVPKSECIHKLDTRSGDPFDTIESSTIAHIIEERPNTLVRVIGLVKKQLSERSLAIRDLSGEAIFNTEQSTQFDPGATVEVIGYPTIKDDALVLEKARCRVFQSDRLTWAQEIPAEAGVLRFIDQVQGLTESEIAEGRQAFLYGVVTWFKPGNPSLFIQDATGGVRLHAQGFSLTGINFGSILKIKGEVMRGESTPEILVQQMTLGADAKVNPPRQINLDQALAGIAENQRVELTGFLREATPRGDETILHLTTPSGEFSASVATFPELNRMLNSVIHVRGVCELHLHSESEGARVHVLVQSPDDLTIEAALPADLTALPQQTIDQLNARGVRTERNRWVRTSGVLTLQDLSSFFYLQEGSHSLRVLTRETPNLRLGAKVDVVGLLGREGGKQVLREARVLSSMHGDSAPIEPALANAEPNRQLDGRVAQLSGLVFDTLDRADQRRVILQVGEKLIEARFVDPAKAAFPENCLPGAEVTVTGIYHVELNDYQQPRNFTLLLRTSEDIVVNRASPWWTLGRALRASVLLVLIVAGAIVWVALLRRRVRAQTVELLAQRDKEAKLEAELERSSRLESLGLLAGGIAHDFNNMLTVVVGNITLALMETDARSRATELLEEAEKGALRARELTQQLLTFARGGDPVRAPVSLSALVREAADFALSGSKVGTEYDFTPNLPAAHVDKAQIAQAVHNLVLHAAQSMPNGGRILFFLRDTRIFDGDIPGLASGTYLKLSITDSGPGIPAEHLGRIFDPYFQSGPSTNGLGLATVRSIIKRHQGHIAVTSRSGEGTTFTVWLPTAREEPEPEKRVTVTEESKKSLRVLFMDDEEAIRRFAHNLLSRLGHDATTVSDGTEAVHAYAAAFEINKPYDVVVLDLTIAGGMGGREALEHLQNIDPNVRAIVSSGYSSDQILSEYRRYGFSGIVSKPYKIADLAQALQDVMKQPPASPSA